MAMSVSDWVFVMTNALVLLFSVTSNMLVVSVVIKNPKMRNVTNIFICNLAVCDILLAGVLLPMRLHDLSHEEHFHEGAFVCRIVNGFPILCISGSIYTLVAVSFERRKAIVLSLGKQITIDTCKKIIPSIWLAAIITSLPTVLEFSLYIVEVKMENGTRKHLSCGSNEVPRIYSVINGICLLCISYIVPLLLVWFNYASVIHFVLKQTRQIDDVNAPSAGIGSQSVVFKKRMRIVKMLIVVAVLFAICWLPFFVSLMIAKITGEDDSEDAGGAFNLSTIALATFSTGYNVIVYVIFNANFRSGIRDILCGCRRKENKQIINKNTGCQSTNNVS